MQVRLKCCCVTSLRLRAYLWCAVRQAQQADKTVVCGAANNKVVPMVVMRLWEMKGG